MPQISEAYQNAIQMHARKLKCGIFPRSTVLFGVRNGILELDSAGKPHFTEFGRKWIDARSGRYGTYHRDKARRKD